MRKCIDLHLQIHFGVNMSGVNGDMPKPSANGIDVHP